MDRRIITVDDLRHIVRKGYATTPKGLLRVAKKYETEQHCTKDHRYNGWTNYETWNVALWLDNDQGSQEYWREVAQDVYSRKAEASKHQTLEEHAAQLLGELMESEIEDSAQEMLKSAGQAASMFSDLLGAALSEVNWYEIAEHYIEDIDKG